MSLVKRYGQMVVPGSVKVGDFARDFNTVAGTNSYFDGTWEEVEELVRQHWHDQSPGTASENGDVVLVNVPPARFYTSIVPITDANRSEVKVVEHVRREGEKPVVMRMMDGVKYPASFVQIVVYRADVLARDGGRTTDAEWEIVAINAQPDDLTPMHPTMMARNENDDEGGTLRTYTEQEWARAHEYWDRHAYINQVEV